MHLVPIILWYAFSALGVGCVGWLIYWVVKDSEDRRAAISKIIMTLAIVAGDVLFCRHMSQGLSEGLGLGNMAIGLAIAGSIAAAGVALSILWTPQLAELVASPLTGLFDGGRTPPERKAFYSIAHARRKRGEFAEAIVAVQEQLAKFPNDYEGIVLLASIQAENVKDLASAEATLNAFCAREESPPRQVAAAMTLLADWQLKLGHDVGSAQATLQRIIERYPATPLATAAAQRLAHLGGTDKILAASRDRPRVVVPQAIPGAGFRDTLQDIVPQDVAPETVAAELVKHLEAHPVDIEAREKLARIYAQHFRRLDLARDQLNELIAQHAQSPKRVAHWLNLFADLQIRSGGDYEAVRPTLEKIIELFPDLPVANLAQSRLNHLKLEIKGRQEGPASKTLGEYEQNIGLKYGPTYGSSR